MKKQPKSRMLVIAPTEFADQVSPDGSAMRLHVADERNAVAIELTTEQLQGLISNLIQRHAVMKLTEVLPAEADGDPRSENHADLIFAIVRELEGATYPDSGGLAVRVTAQTGQRVHLEFPPNMVDQLRALLNAVGPTLQ